MRPLRVAVVAACPFPYPRGTPVRALRLSEAVARLGHSVHVATYHIGEGPVDPAVRVHRLRGPGWIRPLRPGPTLGKLAVLDPLLLGALRRMLDRDGPFDVIHAHHYEGLLLALATRRNRHGTLPVVYDAHTLLESELGTYSAPVPVRVREVWGRWLDRTIPRRADHVVAVSRGLRDRLISDGGLAPTTVTRVGNGLEPEAFVPRPPKRPPPADGGTLVYAGNLAPYHRVDLLLEAFRRLLRIRPRAALRIYTSSPTEEIRAQARALGIADRLDFQSVAFPEVCGALAEADVAINPRPVCEGVPQKNLNYMAAGLPLVAFRHSLHPYRDGVSGVGVEPVSAEGLSDAVAALLSAPERASEYGEAARRTAEAELSWGAAAVAVDRVYRQLVAGTGPEASAPGREEPAHAS